MNKFFKYFLTVTIIIFQLYVFNSTYAAPVHNMPVMRFQPNGDTLHCFISGDEYYHRLHDADGYTIIQHPTTGWYVYADREWNADHSDWNIVPTNHIAGSVNPATAGISCNIIASPATISTMHGKWKVPQEEHSSTKALTNRNRGKINNIVIFIRFADDDEISTPFSTIESMFNDSSANAVSLHNYFWRASYSQLRIPTYFYPSPNNDTVISYCDSLPRNRYMPYNSTTNPTGYVNDDQRRLLEFGLIERAVNYINSINCIPSDLDLDMDNDANIDNICFIVKGTYTGWSDLLWPHKWSLYDRYVYINGKRVYTFNFQLEGSGSHYFSTSTFCHEMFHTLGAPDLYHYENYTEVSSVGSWDLMCSNTNPPQHMGMYMKMQYGKWIDTIPEITEAGTYTLNSVGDSIHTNNQCYRIKAGDPSQWYMLEYRDNTELFETALGGRGLLIYRIDSRFYGCSNFDAVNNFDEVYIFRPGGTDDITSGHLSQAFFSAGAGRTAFSSSTDPSPWLTGNIADTTIEISNISAAGNTISFTYTPHRPVVPNCGDSACILTVEMSDQYGDTWNGGYLSFETTDGTVLSTATMGDGCSRETQSISLCRQPTVVRWNSGVSPNECGYKITLADGSVWRNTQNAANTTILGTIFDPCEAYVPNLYTITVQSNDTINHVSGSGTFMEGTIHNITATNGVHYDFLGWHDGPYNGSQDVDIIHNTNSIRSITVDRDSLFTAIFAPKNYYVSALPAHGHENFGSTNGSDTLPYGSTFTIVAEPAPGYEFDYWRRNNMSTHITQNPLTDIVTTNLTYRAYFRPTNGIVEHDNSVDIYSIGKQVYIMEAKGRHFDIINTLGQVVMTGTVNNSESCHILPNTGIYIVRIEGYKPIKIIAR